jgi:putative phosphoesterase
MRIAVISDIHGNQVALQAVLANIQRVGVDQLVCLGDVATLGPDPRAVIHTLRELQCPCVLGNHDAFLLDPALLLTYTTAPVIHAAVDWCHEQLTADELTFLRGFRPTIELVIDDLSSLLCFHGSPRSHMDTLLATTPVDALDRLIAGYEAAVLLGGHTHIQMLRQHRGKLIVNPGSVGMPFKEFVTAGAPTLLLHAEYALVEMSDGALSIELRRLPLRKSDLAAAVAASDTPLRDMLLEQYA